MSATLTRPPKPAAAAAVTAAVDPVDQFRVGLFKFNGADMDQLVRLGVLPEGSTVELLGGLFVSGLWQRKRRTGRGRH